MHNSINDSDGDDDDDDDDGDLDDVDDDDDYSDVDDEDSGSRWTTFYLFIISDSDSCIWLAKSNINQTGADNEEADKARTAADKDRYGVG